MHTTLHVLTVAVVLGSAPMLVATQHSAMPSGTSHEEHQKQMQKDAEAKKRGAAAMGFDQDAVAHHFVLTSEGGAIQVDVIDASDQANRQAIRAHLREIATAFASGDFTAPFVTHAEEPPGVGGLKRLKSSVTYTFIESPNGGRVRIAGANPEARAAIHEFLRYQIKEHRTGDPLTVVK